jgi:signal transduction histidine kinase
MRPRIVAFPDASAGPAPEPHGFVDAQRHALEMIVKSAPLGDVLTYLASVIERQSPGQAIAAILLLDRTGRLYTGAAPSLPPEYSAAIDGIAADPRVGTCAAAAATRAVVVTRDIENDARWKGLKQLPLGLGLRAAWSQPILGGDGTVLGTFGTYFRECREPSDDERLAVAVLSHTAALAIERHHAERARQHAETRRNEFLAVLSHELRNPLGALRMGIELLGLARDGESTSLLRQRMVRQVDQLTRLVGELTEVSRITRGELMLQLATIDLVTAAHAAIEITEPLLQPGRHTLRVDLPDRPVMVVGDPLRLAQVLANLLSNAAKYSEPSTQITLRVRTEGDHVEAAVEDDGIGIAAGEFEHIFEMFSRGSHAGVQAQWGLGVGLALARQLTEMHGGTVTAASDGPGKGSTFTVRLPLAS